MMQINLLAGDSMYAPSDSQRGIILICINDLLKFQRQDHIHLNVAQPANKHRREETLSYKTILVYLNDSRRTEALLQPAIRMASRYNAHLIGLHTQLSVPIPSISLPYGAQVVGGNIAAKRKESEQEIASTFERMTARQSFVPEWRTLTVSFADLASTVLEHGRAADLIIAGQADPNWDLSALLDFPETLVLESGRPVLIVPHSGRYPTIARNVVIAWKAGREAARAVFDALPLLVRAEKVHILEVKEHGERKDNALASDTSIAVALARHAIKPSVETSVASDISVGDAIISRLTDLEADLLVMGAYSHSRMRELIFGGVTRQITRHMTVPTLLSH